MYEHKSERDALFSATGGKYVELRLLNEVPTGFGWAVLVEDQFRRACVAKLPNSPNATSELRNEAEILARIRELEHPNLVQLRDLEKCQIAWQGVVEERLFLVMQYGGVNLRSRLGRLSIRRQQGEEEIVYTGGHPWPLDEWFPAALQMADGLRALHDFQIVPGEHIVHRDIKPENILIDREGRIRITDFGISRVVERLSAMFTVGGTLPYLAPEYARGRINSSCDIYSLGVTFYEMATGAFPYRRFADKWTSPVSPRELNPDFPESLSRLIMRMLAFDPRAEPGHETRARYQTGGQVLEELRQCRTRLFPIPDRFELLNDARNEGQLHFDVETRKTVRVLTYELNRKDLILFRLAALVSMPWDFCVRPVHLFDVGNLVGVVTPVVPWDAPATRIALETTLDPMASPVTEMVGPPQQLRDVPWLRGLAENLRIPVRAGVIREGPTGARRQRPVLPTAAREAAADAMLRRIALLAEMLQPLHDAGVLHGTITPYTAVWTERGWVVDDLWVQLFVGACPLSAVYSPSDPVVSGLAPEILAWSAPPQATTDVYGLATLAFAALTGEVPVTPRSELHPARTWPEEVPHRWREMIERALSADPRQRPQSLREFATQLRSCCWEQEWLDSLLVGAQTQHAGGQIVEAYDALDLAQRRDPGNPRVHHVRALLFLRDGSPEHALAENQIAYDIDPQADVCLLQARCLHALHRDAEALRSLRESLALADSLPARELLSELAGSPPPSPPPVVSPPAFPGHSPPA